MMTSIKREKIVPYSVSHMYDLVNDIERYPEFLPGCQSTTILHRDEDEVRAKVVLAKAGVHHSFTTLNRLQHNKMIEVRLVEGPFRHLEGFWRFDEINETGTHDIEPSTSIRSELNRSEAKVKGCHVQFNLEFELSNRLLNMTLGPIFNNIANKFIDAFCERANILYGNK